MAKNKKIEITDKQSSIRNYMQNILWLKNIIDAHGNILNLDRFHAEVDTAISNCKLRMSRHVSIDGVVQDREMYSISLGELEYLQGLATHTKNFDSLKEQNIISHEDLPKSNKPGFATKVKNARLAIQNKIANWLIK